MTKVPSFYLPLRTRPRRSARPARWLAFGACKRAQICAAADSPLRGSRAYIDGPGRPVAPLGKRANVAA